MVNPPSWSLFYEVVVDSIYGVVRPSTLATLTTMAISFACYVQSVHHQFVLPAFSPVAGAVVLVAFLPSRTRDIPVRRALARPAERLQVWLAEPASKPWPGRPTEKN